MKQMPWKVRKGVLKSPGFSINYFCGNPAIATSITFILTNNK